MYRWIFLTVALLSACTREPVVLHPPDQIPERLSAWRVVLSDGDYLSLNDRVQIYALNTPLFSDYAHKLRTVWMPSGRSAAYRAEGPLEFPVGTIISKTFYYEKGPGFSPDRFEVVTRDSDGELDSDGRLALDRYVLVETRLLVHYEQGWKAIPYVWNPGQNEARLAIAGDVFPIQQTVATGGELFAYLVPDMNQCAGCHTVDHSAKHLQPIGPKAWQLNRSVNFGPLAGNQLEAWARAGLLTGLPGTIAAGSNWRDPGSSTVEQRVRAYLDSNCAHCHNGRGAADTSGLDLSLDAPPGRASGICKPPVAVGRGSGDRPYDIYPGHPEKSILLYRMQQNAPAIAMPELGRSIVHQEAVDLIETWIRSLEQAC